VVGDDLVKYGGVVFIQVTALCESHTNQQTRKYKKRESEHGGRLLTMVVMLGSREVKEDMEAKERSTEKGRKEGRKGGGVKE
jgi:hypothetical protein